MIWRNDILYKKEKPNIVINEKWRKMKRRQRKEMTYDNNINEMSIYIILQWREDIVRREKLWYNKIWYGQWRNDRIWRMTIFCTKYEEERIWEMTVEELLINEENIIWLMINENEASIDIIIIILAEKYVKENDQIWRRSFEENIKNVWHWLKRIRWYYYILFFW